MALLSKKIRRAARQPLGRLLALLALLSSCETVVELDLPEPEPQLVLNSVLNPDSVFTADLSASRSIFSNGPHTPLTTALVQVYQAGQLLEELPHQGQGQYRGTHRPQPRLAYELRASAPGYPSVRATTQLPAPPALRDVKASRGADTDFGARTVEAAFVLTDDPAQENFYYLQAYRPEIDRFNNARTYNQAVSIIQFAPFEGEFSMEARYFFSDRLFNGQTVPFHLRLETNPDRPTYVRVAHVSKAYYDYVRTLRQQSYGDNVLPSPVTVPSNITDGLGVLASYSAATLYLKP
ncbi:DUF4249 domain-containing protein [Hymenobacter sp. BT683]|uniref:DUF4249 domain-containing protein n=1 Tax=Hymenobacter jeongseonensis TaxID=2791027 RepID=A0ABS0ILT3_9BACT|nr:DUF4249 domain-containing protein [Hymenobacter jeongseonensis]MBF9239276.1 DUF4249 domain-containing protein [Hymenobacter jeongseonensis]